MIVYGLRYRRIMTKKQGYFCIITSLDGIRLSLADQVLKCEQTDTLGTHLVIGMHVCQALYAIHDILTLKK